MGLLGNKNNKLKANPPRIRIEKVVVDRPAPPKPNPKSIVSNLEPRGGTPSHRPSPKPAVARRKSASPYPSSADESRLDRKRKAGSSAVATSRRSLGQSRVEFDSDSDGGDDEWMTEKRKRQRATDVDRSHRKLKSSRAFSSRDDHLEFIHAVDVASLQHQCVPVMGAQPDEVAIELQYPSLQRPERYELVWGKDRIDAVQASIRMIEFVAEIYLSNEEARPFTDPNSGIIRRLQKTSNSKIQDLNGFKEAIHEYNDTILRLVEDGIVEKTLESLHELPPDFVEFVCTQVYDRTVAPRVELLSKYDAGSDHVYGELLHPLITKIIVQQGKMTSDQVFVDLGSGVGNVVLQAALEVGCESWGCEMMENACNLAEAQKKEFDARCLLWGLRPGKAYLERGDFRKNARIHDALKRADLVLVNNKAFTSQLNDDLVRMFLDLKIGCKIVSLKSFAADSKSHHNINDVASSILDVEEFTYPEESVSWTSAGGPYYISTRK